MYKSTFNRLVPRNSQRRSDMDRTGPWFYTPEQKFMVDFRIKVRTIMRHDPDANVYVCSCPDLGLVSQGRDEDEADRAIHSAINLFIITCYELDILHSTLKRLHATRREVPNELRFKQKQIEVCIPLPLTA